MSSPARVAACLCSAAVLFAACSLRKAEISPEGKEDLAPGSQYEQPVLAPAPERDRADAASTRSEARKVRESGSLDRLHSGQAAYPAPEPSAKQAAPAYMLPAPAEKARLGGRRDGLPYREEDGYSQDTPCSRCPPPPRANAEEYAPIYENAFLEARANPLSTFSIDVDGASYSNTRRLLQEGRLPPVDAVRLEEFINYFDYEYPQPAGSDPFSITTEVASTPWNPDTKLVHIGLQGRRMDSEKLPPNNLVFLIDVSGSMATPDKLPLLRNGFQMLIDQLRPRDRISIVVYAGAAGMVLPPTSGSDKESIRQALDRLQAGGSTAGGAGLMLAYQAARESFIQGGSNRVILATDGDFNVGVSSDAELVRLIEEKRESGVFLSVLGFGTGNLKDSKMEQLADKGNGNYFYIDNLGEARKVLVEKMTGTLCAIAKDVKLQIEFNPALVESYRLVGYENRVLAAEDFNDDRKDAGELGAGAGVTALYEIAPAAPARPEVDPLKYRNNGSPRWRWGFGSGEGGRNGELLTVKFRYKQPAGTSSKLLSRTLRNGDAAWQDASENFRFSAAAAGFGLILRGSRYRGNLDLDKVAAMARGAKGRDLQGRRAEFLTLVETAKSLAGADQVGYRQYGE
ncbi:MAG TPA: VWA domain-containing protein [Fibrobacteria bacterium]|nr:VWA domain-containing protein [Fibrobacteria bacterium]